MPKKQYAPLTAEERAEAEKLFREHLEKINTYFASQGQPTLNEEEAYAKFQARLNDEAMVARYRIASEIKERDEAQSKIMSDLHATRAPKDDLLGRNFKFYLKTDGSLESKAYNQKLWDAYCDDPVAFAHVANKKLMTYNPKPLLDLHDDPVALAEFYRDNQALCHQANEFGDYFSQKAPGVLESVKSALPSMRELVQSINGASKGMARAEDLLYFGFPELSEEQAKELLKNSKAVFGPKTPKPVKNALFAMNGTQKNIKSLSQKIEELKGKGLEFEEKDFFLKYKAVTFDAEKNKDVETSLMNLGKEGVHLEKRSAEEISGIKQFSSKYQYRYNEVFHKAMSERLHKPYNVFKSEREMKGNLWDRFFHRPSSSFKTYMKALKDYSKVGGPYFGDKTRVLRLGAAYLNFGEGNQQNLEGLSDIERRRIQFVKDSFETIQEMKQKEEAIEQEIDKGLVKDFPKDNAPIKREPAIEGDNIQLVEENNPVMDISLNLDMEGPKQEKQLDAAGGEVKEPELNMEDPAKAN